MICRDAVFAGRVVLCALDGTDGALAPHPALKLRADFVSGALFHGIGATSGQEENREQ
jgi:hypothetical protein